MPEATRIRNLPASEKPRERLLSKGTDALREGEMIANLLRTGTQGLSAIDVAQSLLTKLGSLEALAKALVDELRVKGVDHGKAVTLKAAFSLAKRMANELRNESPVLDAGKTGRAFARGQSTAGSGTFSRGADECQAAAYPLRDSCAGHARLPGHPPPRCDSLRDQRQRLGGVPRAQPPKRRLHTVRGRYPVYAQHCPRRQVVENRRARPHHPRPPHYGAGQGLRLAARTRHLYE